MILRKYGKKIDIHHRLAIGQISLILGIGGFYSYRFTDTLIHPFFSGLIVGFSSVLFGISLVFNLSTLPRVIQRFKLDK